jgi:hypothetical protein
MTADTIASDVSLAISGLFLLVAAVLLVLRLRNRRQVRGYRLSELTDLSRDDIDPHWPQVRDTHSDPPPSWDPCVTEHPHRPEDPPQPPHQGR